MLTWIQSSAIRRSMDFTSKENYFYKERQHLFCSVWSEDLHLRTSFFITYEKNSFNIDFVPLFHSYSNQNLSLWQHPGSSKKRILHEDTYSSAMSILQSRLTFQLTIKDDTHLKYSHSDWVHHFINNRSRIRFSHTIEYDVVAEYLNNVSVHFFAS